MQKLVKISMTNDKNSAKALEVWPIVCRKGIRVAPDIHQIYCETLERNLDQHTTKKKITKETLSSPKITSLFESPLMHT